MCALLINILPGKVINTLRQNDRDTIGIPVKDNVYLTDFAYSVGVIPNFSLNCREK